MPMRLAWVQPQISSDFVIRATIGAASHRRDHMPAGAVCEACAGLMAWARLGPPLRLPRPAYPCRTNSTSTGGVWTTRRIRNVPTSCAAHNPTGKNRWRAGQAMTIDERSEIAAAEQEYLGMFEAVEITQAIASLSEQEP